MPNEVTSLRLLALAYAKGHLTRAEYLHKRGQQLSALEFGQAQPTVDETNTLLNSMGNEISFLKGAKIGYFEGIGDAAAAARMRARVTEAGVDDAEHREYNLVNRLVIIVGFFAVVGVAMQLLFEMLVQQKQEEELQNIGELISGSGGAIDLSKELNIKTSGADEILTAAEYDKLAAESPVGQALRQVLNVDLDNLKTGNVNEIVAMLGAIDDRQRRMLVSTTWFDNVVNALGDYADKLDQDLGAEGDNSELAKLSPKQLNALADRRNAFLRFYGDLGEMQFEYDTDGG